ncbi:hypothetical protein FCV25MIE_14407, partial [Fagus crenata]
FADYALPEFPPPCDRDPCIVAVGQCRCSTVLILGVRRRGSTPVFYSFDFEGSTSWVKCRWFGGFDDRVNAVVWGF